MRAFADKSIGLVTPAFFGTVVRVGAVELSRPSPFIISRYYPSLLTCLLPINSPTHAAINHRSNNPSTHQPIRHIARSSTHSRSGHKFTHLTNNPAVTPPVRMRRLFHLVALNRPNTARSPQLTSPVSSQVLRSNLLANIPVRSRTSSQHAPSVYSA